MFTDEDPPETSGQARSDEGPDLASKREGSHPAVGSETRTERLSKPIFAVPNWQKAYGEALLYADSPGSGALIAYAEKEIVARYLADSSSPIQSDEGRDLLQAMGVLSQLRKKRRTNAVN
jgi:hypothetical protein